MLYSELLLKIACCCGQEKKSYLVHMSLCGLLRNEPLLHRYDFFSCNDVLK